MATGKLYLLPTTISETDLDAVIPSQVAARARQITRFYVEAAKTARAYLKALAHPLPISSLVIEEIGHDPDPTKLTQWLQPVLDGEDAAIVSESGCPGVADPGAQLVAKAHELGIPVVPLTGPSSILLTLMASGLDGQRFRFCGYLPIHEEERKAAVLALEAQSRHSETQLFIETPYRNASLLASLLAWLSPSTRVTVATDVTGQSEAITTLTVQQWRARVGTTPELPKLPTVFAILAAPHGEPPRYASQNASRKGSRQERAVSDHGHRAHARSSHAKATRRSSTGNSSR